MTRDEFLGTTCVCSSPDHSHCQTARDLDALLAAARAEALREAAKHCDVVQAEHAENGCTCCGAGDAGDSLRALVKP